MHGGTDNGADALVRIVRWIVLVSLVATPLGFALVQDDGAEGENWSARLLDLSSSYGSESWKYDAEYLTQASPADLLDHFQNQSTNFNGALGLRATLRIQIFEETDASAAPDTSYSVKAVIGTSGGDLPAYVKRDATDASMYQIDFDLDGANHGDPRGIVIPPADPGTQTVNVQILKRFGDDPRPAPVGEATMQFTYSRPAQTISVADYAGLRHVQDVPDSIFRLWTDVGWGESVRFITRPVTTNAGIQLDYQFDVSAAGQTVDLRAFIVQRGVSTPGGNQPVPGGTFPPVPGVTDQETFEKLLENAERLVVVNEGVVATQPLDATGFARFDVTGTQLMAVAPTPPDAALVAVAPVLGGNFDAASCGEDCLGGSQYVVSAAEMVAPITGQTVAVDGFELVDPDQRGGDVPEQVPQPIRDVALGLNALEVTVRDVDGFQQTDSRSGDAWAIVADARSDEPLSGARLSPSQKGPNLLTGNLGVRGIQEQRVSNYRVMTLLYQASDDFYGVAWADRGYRMTLDAPVNFVPPGAGGVWVNLTSVTTNYDTVPDDLAFQISVTYTVNVPQFGIDNASRSVVLDEAGFTTEFVPLSTSQVGEFPVTVYGTSGDVLPLPQTVNAVFTALPEERGLADRIPGFEAALLVAAVFLGALIVRRRGLA